MELKCPSIHFLTKFYCAGPCVKQGTDTKGHEAQALSLESTVLWEVAKYSHRMV